MRAKIFLMMLTGVLCFLTGCGTEKETVIDSDRFGSVQIIAADQGDGGTDCWVEADLELISDEKFGAELYGPLKEVWEQWNSLDEMRRMLSSSLPGYCTLRLDTWEECEEAVGIDIHNPLESYDWLETADHIGIALDTPVAYGERKHAEVNWRGSDEGDIYYVTVDSGYRYEDMRVTLSVTLDSEDDGGYRFGIDWSEGTAFEVEEYAMKNGNTAQMITPRGAGNYSSIEAYFVQDGMLYKIYIVGSTEQESEVRDTLERILTEFK